MTIDYRRGALGVALWTFVALPAFALPEGAQVPGASVSSASPSSCAQNSQGVTRTIDALSGQIDEARQTNDAAKMRAAVADLQVVLAQMKNQLADCTGLTEASAMGNMAGMDHSKMQRPPGTPVRQPDSTVAAAEAKTATPMPGMDHSKMQMAPKPATASGARASGAGAKAVPPAAGMDHAKMAGAPSANPQSPEPSKVAGMDHSKMTGEKPVPGAAATSSKAAHAPAVVFALRTEPAPPRSGKNDFEVTVKDGDGKPIADAEVSLAFDMSPMPSMKMPDMRQTLTLTSSGHGIYQGSATLGMAGDWDVTVTASRNGQPLDVKKMKLTAK